MLSMVTLPTATSTLAGIGAYSSVWFNEYITYALFAVGVLLGFMLLRWLIGVVIDGVKNFKFNTREDRMANERERLWGIIKEKQQIDKDFELWKRSQQ